MKQTKGFTLVELMIVVAIIGIISAVAIPQYTQYVVRGNRAAAQAFMMDIANREKQYLLDARSYTANWAIAAPAPTLGMAIPNDVSKNYNITICMDSASADAACTTASSPPFFRITATPIAGKAQANDGALTVNDSGAQTWGAANKW